MADARRLADEFAALLPYSVFGPEERKAFADEVCSRLAPLDSPIITAASGMLALLRRYAAVMDMLDPSPNCSIEQIREIGSVEDDVNALLARLPKDGA